MQVIEKIVDDRLGLGLPSHHCTQDFKGKLSFQFYDSVRGSHTVICGNCSKIKSYIMENDILYTIGDYGYYFTMSRDAVRLHEKGIITYKTTRASSSKPNLSIVALSEDNILAEEELSRFNRVSTNIYDIILNNKGVVHDIPYFSFDLDRFDYISEDCCFLRVLNKKSDWRSIMDILATGKYYRYNDKVYIYKSDNKWYCYRITDADKFDLLYTKLQVFKKEE